MIVCRGFIQETEGTVPMHILWDGKLSVTNAITRLPQMRKLFKEQN
jgi:hypothetical protein